jgi:hypothetical protein
VLDLLPPSTTHLPSDFRLAARLASVAKLNCPSGRKPRIAVRRESNSSPAIPSARLGAKRSRPTQGDQRILATCRRWHTAEIIVFPGSSRLLPIETAAMDLAA